MKTTKEFNIKALFFIFLVIGSVWARSGYGKLNSGNFAENLGLMLTKNAQSNPFPLYKDFLHAIAIPNSVIFGQLTMWGELLTALAIVGSVLYLLRTDSPQKFAYWILGAGLTVGLFLNLNFWFAFSWTSPANDSLNLLMGLIELIGIITVFRLQSGQKFRFKNKLGGD